MSHQAVGIVIVALFVFGCSDSSSVTTPPPNSESLAPRPMTAVATSVSATSSSAPALPPAPPYKIVDNSSLAPKRGRRIEAQVEDASISDEQCAAVIEALRAKAAPDGQVSVHVPLTDAPGEYAPLCIENFDGSGIEKGIARQMNKMPKK